MENKTPMMQKRTMNITAFEYKEVPKDEWSKEELSKIEQLNATMGVDILSIGFKQGKHVVMATSYVGVIRIMISMWIIKIIKSNPWRIVNSLRL